MSEQTRLKNALLRLAYTWGNLGNQLDAQELTAAAWLIEDQAHDLARMREKIKRLERTGARSDPLPAQR